MKMKLEAARDYSNLVFSFQQSTDLQWNPTSWAKLKFLTQSLCGAKFLFFILCKMESWWNQLKYLLTVGFKNGIIRGISMKWPDPWSDHKSGQIIPSTNILYSKIIVKGCNIKIKQINDYFKKINQKKSNEIEVEGMQSWFDGKKSAIL